MQWYSRYKKDVMLRFCYLRKMSYQCSENNMRGIMIVKTSIFFQLYILNLFRVVTIGVLYITVFILAGDCIV